MTKRVLGADFGSALFLCWTRLILHSAYTHAMLIPAHSACEEYRNVVRSALIAQHRYSKLEAILACERHCALAPAAKVTEALVRVQPPQRPDGEARTLITSPKGNGRLEFRHEKEREFGRPAAALPRRRRRIIDEHLRLQLGGAAAVQAGTRSAPGAGSYRWRASRDAGRSNFAARCRTGGKR